MGTRWMRGRPAAFVLALASMTVAADALAQEKEHNPPFRGKVTGSSVNIRMSAGRDGTIVRVAREGESLVIVGKESNWYRIVPPENAWCWISASAVKKSEGGSLVSRDTVLRNDARNNATEIGRIEKGAAVKILVEKVDWYKIQAPPSVAMYIHGDFVAFERAYDPQADGPIPSELAAKPEHVKPVHVKPGGAEPAPATAPKTTTFDEAVKAREDVVRKYEQDIKRIEGEYERRMKDATAKKAEPKKQYDRVGHVDTVGLFLDRPGTHALVNAQKVICYLKSADPERVKLDKYYNQLVGVRGRAEPARGYEPLQVITVELIEPIAKN